jgi:hypothetical protein
VKHQLGTNLRILGEEAYVEHGRILESLAVGRHPLIQCDGLAFFEDIFDATIEPTMRRRTGKIPEWRFGVANLVFEEDEEEDGERGRKKRAEGKEREHRS